MGTNANIAVDELPAELIHQVSVMRSTDQLIILVNSQPYVIDVNKASSLT